MPFTSEQVAALSANLDGSRVKSRKQGGRDVNYIEGWHAIAEANRIFGFDAWCRETVDIRCVAERERTIGGSKPGWGVSYVAKVRVTVGGVTRDGTGAGHGIDADLGQAHESAIKEAETDAMKRALMTFGHPFGLALYDKSQEHVEDKPREVTRRQQRALPAPDNKPSEEATIAKALASAMNAARTLRDLEKWGDHPDTIATAAKLPNERADGFWNAYRARLRELAVKENPDRIIYNDGTPVSAMDAG